MGIYGCIQQRTGGGRGDTPGTQPREQPVRGTSGCSIRANGISYRNVADAHRRVTRAAGGNPIVLSEKTPRLAQRTVSEASA